MEPLEFWNTYVDDTTPADFVWHYGKGNLHTAVGEYLRERPSLFGIIRRGAWRETFRARNQFNREYVASGLTAYLEESEKTWRPLVEEARQKEARARAEAKARAEAEALALAVARVEAEARARAEAERQARINPEQPGGPTETESEDLARDMSPSIATATSETSDESDTVSQAVGVSTPETVHTITEDPGSEKSTNAGDVTTGETMPCDVEKTALNSTDRISPEPVQERVGAEPSDTGDLKAIPDDSVTP